MGCGERVLSGPSKSLSIAFAKPTKLQECEGAHAHVTVCVKWDGMEKTNLSVTRISHCFFFLAAQAGLTLGALFLMSMEIYFLQIKCPVALVP